MGIAKVTRTKRKKDRKNTAKKNHCKLIKTSHRTKKIGKY